MKTKTQKSKTNKNTTNSDANLSIAFTNIRGLSSNMDATRQFLENKVPDVFFLTETQVSKEGDIDGFNVQGYTIEEAFSLKRGLCAYIKNGVAYTRSKKYEIDCRAVSKRGKKVQSHFNTLVLKTLMMDRLVHIVGVYRSPNTPTTIDFFQLLTDKLDELISDNPTTEIVVVGDFNVHNPAWLQFSSSDPQHIKTGMAAELMASSHNLTQIIRQPTHIPGNDGKPRHLLDLCLTTIPHLTTITKVDAPLGGSDHLLVSSRISIQKPPILPPEKRRVWHYKRANWKLLGNLLAGFPWEMHCLYNNNVNDAANNFTDTVTHFMSKCIPNSLKSPKQPRPWFTLKSQEARNTKSAAFSKFINSGSDEDRAVYVEARKVCKRTIREEKDLFIRSKAEQFAEHPTGTREFWKCAKAVRSNFTTSSIPPLKHGDEVITDPVKKADLLASHFHANSTFDSILISPTPIIKSSTSMNPIKIRESVVYNILKGLQTKKATGPDGIPAAILKRFASIFAPILSKIFSLSLEKGIFPDSWKIASVQPVPKKGDKTDPSNYRPIAIIPVLAKVFEQYINQELVDHLTIAGILDDKQYGFRGKRSTGDLLFYVTHLWSKAMDNHGESFVVALDIAKAFDKVWHANLLMKLDACGLNSTLLQWIESFLSRRKFSVKLDGVSSQQFEVNAGVPQGSVLSPTLFLVYINDLLKLTSNPIHSYADDSTLHATYFEKSKTRDDHRKETISSLNSDLRGIVNWGKTNMVKFNETKTQLCGISRCMDQNEYPVEMNDQVITNCPSFRMLGVNVDSKLLWDDHIMAMAKNTAKKLGFLYRSRRYFSASQLLLIYKSFIRPCLEYCSHVWGSGAETHLKLLDSVQRRAIRLINNDELTKDLDSLQHRRNVADLTILYKYKNGQCSAEIKNLMPGPKPFNRDTRQSCSANKYFLEVTRSHTSHFQRQFLNRTVPRWNSLPDKVFPVRVNVQVFKVNAHKHLLKLGSLPETPSV